MKTRIMWVTMKEGRSEHTSARAMHGSIEDKPDKVIMMYAHTLRSEIILSTYIGSKVQKETSSLSTTTR